MQDRGLLIFLMLVVGAVYALRSGNNPQQQIQIPKVDMEAEPAQEKPMLDLEAIENSLGLPTTQPKSPTVVPQPFLGDFKPKRMFVGASKVNVRATPGKTGKLVAQLQVGTELNVISVKEGWSQVKTRDGKVGGWISSNFLSGQKAKSPSASATTPNPKPKPAAPVKLTPPKIDRSAVVQQIIAFSIQNYSGNCPCPYNTMRNGRSCGGRSAYSRPGGKSPICYPGDVNDEMVRQWVSR